MHLKININFLEKYLANFVNDIEYKRITKKLKEYDLMADIDDQRFIIFVIELMSHTTIHDCDICID